MASDGGLGRPLAGAQRDAGRLADVVDLEHLDREDRDAEAFFEVAAQRIAIGEDELDGHLDALVGRHGWWVVLLGRLLPGVRSVVSLPAGLHRMSRGIFLALTIIGSGVFNAALIGAGWALGSEWDRIQDPVSTASKVIVATVVVALFCWLAIRARRRYVQAREDAAG